MICDVQITLIKYQNKNSKMKIRISEYNNFLYEKKCRDQMQNSNVGKKKIFTCLCSSVLGQKIKHNTELSR